MNWFKQLFSRRRLFNDLSEEIHAHLEEKIEELVATGMRRKEAAAAAAARREFGNVTLMEEDSRNVWQWPSIESFFADVRYGARVLRRSPGPTAVMVLTLALAIGATTAIFSVVYGVLLRPLPFTDANRIMAVFEVNSQGHWAHLADPNFDDFRDQNRSFQAIAKYNSYVAALSGISHPSPTTLRPASPTFPQPPLKLACASSSVTGVRPAGFQFPPDVDLWLPTDLDGENRSRTAHNYFAVGRLRDGVTVEQANQDISAIARRIHDTSSEQNDYLLKDAIVLPLRDSITGKARPALLVLLGAVGFLLLVACANVANLLLAQASVRERELAIRSALGAARGRLIRQFLTEAFLLSLAGGSLGLLGAFWGVAGLVSPGPQNLPPRATLPARLSVILFALLTSAHVPTRPRR